MGDFKGREGILATKECYGSRIPQGRKAAVAEGELNAGCGLPLRSMALRGSELLHRSVALRGAAGCRSLSSLPVLCFSPKTTGFVQSAMPQHKSLVTYSVSLTLTKPVVPHSRPPLRPSA